MILPGRTHVCRFGKPSQNMVWLYYPHLPYSLNVAPSDFCLFGVLIDKICNTKFENNDVIHVMRTWLCEQDKACYQQSIHTLVPHWCKAVEVNRDLWKHRVWSKSIAVHNV
jgi:hypothetical protein